MQIDPNTGEAFFQILAVAATAISAVLLVFARQIRSRLARVRRHITRPEDIVRTRRPWRD